VINNFVQVYQRHEKFGSVLDRRHPSASALLDMSAVMTARVMGITVSPTPSMTAAITTPIRCLTC
jgi:hypothetical protein